MKIILTFFFIFVSLGTYAKFLPDGCSSNQIRVWTQMGYACRSIMPTVSNDCIMCQNNYQGHMPYNNYFQAFPSPLYQPQIMPWWAYQGNMYYPNLHYPGAWSNHGMNSQHYPGQGQVFAAKPNVYIESIHRDKKFSFKFPEGELSFLATTPILEQNNSWKGKIVDGDKFEVSGTYYDYLFYDIRLPKEKMQFTSGQCATREDTIKWMLKDLTEMNYPKIALQDFEQHWSVKIPNYPYFCIYPQYNKQLDEALPVKLGIDHSEFIRSLYVLVAHPEEPSANGTHKIPLPTLESESSRPQTHIRKEVNFKEWGVAFLGE